MTLNDQAGWASGGKGARRKLHYWPEGPAAPCLCAAHRKPQQIGHDYKFQQVSHPARRCLACQRVLEKQQKGGLTTMIIHFKSRQYGKRMSMPAHSAGAPKMSMSTHSGAARGGEGEITTHGHSRWSQMSKAAHPDIRRPAFTLIVGLGMIALSLVTMLYDEPTLMRGVGGAGGIVLAVLALVTLWRRTSSPPRTREELIAAAFRTDKLQYPTPPTWLDELSMWPTNWERW